MKVNDLIAKLSVLPGDLPVFLATDAEGNGFESLCAVASEIWDHDENEAIHPDDAEEGETPSVCVLWP